MAATPHRSRPGHKTRQKKSAFSRRFNETARTPFSVYDSNQNNKKSLEKNVHAQNNKLSSRTQTDSIRFFDPIPIHYTLHVL